VNAVALFFECVDAVVDTRFLNSKIVGDGHNDRTAVSAVTVLFRPRRPARQ
jgi:hypothetical protein